jgi:hypothetical protein
MESITTAAALGCCISGAVILLLRLVLRKVYFRHLDLDYLAAAAILTLVAYFFTIYVAIVWGTANIDNIDSSNAFTAEDIRRRTVGSKCVLVAGHVCLNLCLRLNFTYYVADCVPFYSS